MKRSAFTLVEILIVVILIGILAAVVIPQFTSASDDAKLSALKADLQTVRTQIGLYKAKTGAFPVITGVDATDPLVTAGYVLRYPTNAFTSVTTTTVVAAADDTGFAVDAAKGWWYNSTTGTFKAIDTAGHGAL